MPTYDKNHGRIFESRDEALSALKTALEQAGFMFDIESDDPKEDEATILVRLLYVNQWESTV